MLRTFKSLRRMSGGSPVAVTPTFQGSPVVLPLPSGVPGIRYSVNGVVLDTQPVIKTVPNSWAGRTLIIGNIFTLLFSSPSSNTQTLLTSGQTVSMTFAVAGGASLTGQVSLVSTMVGATLSVFCTLVSPATLSP